MTSTKAMAYPGLALQCPSHWDDITDQVDGDDVPITLADFDSGVGALQFTVALYKDGELPEIDEPTIREMLAEYAENLQLGTPTEVASYDGKLDGAQATYHINEDFLSLWFLTDGTNLIMASYNCDWPSREVEWDTVEQIMATVEIAPA